MWVVSLLNLLPVDRLSFFLIFRIMSHVHSAVFVSMSEILVGQISRRSLQSFHLLEVTSTFFKDWSRMAVFVCFASQEQLPDAELESEGGWHEDQVSISSLSFWTLGDWERSLLMTRVRLDVSSERTRPVVKYGRWLAEQVFLPTARSLAFMAYWTLGLEFRKGEDLPRYSSTLCLTVL